MKDTKIQFTTNEQNAMAMLVETMAKMHYRVNVNGITLTEAFMQNVGDELADIADRFPNTNWGDLYDRFHRQGVNQ